MDKIGEAIKPLTASFLDLLEVERRKKEDNDQTMMVYQPRSSRLRWWVQDQQQLLCQRGHLSKHCGD